MRKLKTRFIFISGGVLSGLGKGLCAASLGILLKKRGYTIGSLKCENYLNIDAGTINPIEHGDPFLCEDGLEADMDLGTYERFLDQNMGYDNFVTKGQIFQKIIEKERSMYYEGDDVEDIPHIVNEIVGKFKQAGKGKDFCLIEIGGTAGEYQNVLYYEAARYLKVKYPGTVVNIHVSYLPIPKHLGEPKTKPTQMSVRTLMSMGINPEFLILRSEVDMDQMRRHLLGLKSGVPGENIIMAKDLKNIYRLPMEFAKQEFDKKVLRHCDLPVRRLDISEWKNLAGKIESAKQNKITIAIVAKYLSKHKGDFELTDAYHALIEAIKHASWTINADVDLKFINANEAGGNYLNNFQNVDGIIVPIGWGSRGVEGKLSAIQYARENKVPYLGLCYGMQLACVEYARNVLNLRNAHTKEVDPDTPYPIIHDIPFNRKYQVIKGDGVSMRLGAYDCILKKDTRVYSIYEKHSGFKDQGKALVSERHRHRFEFNNEYREAFEKSGFIFSGASPDNFFVEMIELPCKVHPFFIATQGHPEYKSRPMRPHPLFIEFEKAAVRFGKNKH